MTSSEQIKESEPRNNHLAVGFTLFVEPEVLSQQEHDIKWKTLIAKVPDDVQVELQYEFNYNDEYWHTLVEILSQRKLHCSVHGPIKNRDIASENEDFRQWSVEENKRAMDLAYQTGSNVFVLHLVPQDDFPKRDKQLEIGFKSFEELVKYKKEKGYQFDLLLENLEYPKWPSNISETRTVLEHAVKIYPNVKFCLDVAHFWHTIFSLNPIKGDIDFGRELLELFNVVENSCEIRRIHFGGAYVQQVNGGSKHATHDIPGLLPGEPYSSNSLHLNEVPSTFKGIWMDSKNVLNLLKQLKKDKPKNSYFDLILEIHISDVETQLEISKIMSDLLNESD